MVIRSTFHSELLNVIAFAIPLKEGCATLGSLDRNQATLLLWLNLLTSMICSSIVPCFADAAIDGHMTARYSSDAHGDLC
jgi:hypothetical protein